MANEVRIHFQLEQDEDDYPPVAVETLWAQPGEIEGEYVIDNIPFFVRDATLEDTIAIREEDGLRWFDRVIRSSGNSLIRVICYDRGYVPTVRDHLAALGCSTEYAGTHNLIAVNIPEGVNLDSVLEFLDQESKAERIGYEGPLLRHA